MRNLAVIYLIFFVLGCATDSEGALEDCKAGLTLYPDEVPIDFFIDYESWKYDGYNFNFHSREERLRKVISFDGTYVDTTLNLNEDERKEVWRLMKKINILSYPTQYKPEAIGISSHEPQYNLTLGFNGITKNIQWQTYTSTYSCQEAHQLKIVLITLDSIILGKNEYQSIQVQGGL